MDIFQFADSNPFLFLFSLAGICFTIVMVAGIVSEAVTLIKTKGK